MNLRDLEYLLALRDTRHFRKASEQCHVSQPTLSGQLRKLEAELGVTLVERDSRNVRLTEAGLAAARRAQRIIEEVRAIREEADIHANPLAGQLRLGLIPTIAPYLCPHIMPALADRFPAIEWQLHEAHTATLLQQLRDGQLDLLILAEVDDIGHYEQHALYTEPLWLALHHRHRLANRKQVSLADLDGETVLMLEDGHCLRDHAMSYCFSAGAKEDPRFRATSLETLRQMVAVDSGLTLLPKLAVPEEITSDSRIRYIRFKRPEPNRKIILLHRRSYSRQQLAHELALEIRGLID